MIEVRTRKQTWDVLERALADIEYTRDPLPKGQDRFQLVRDDAFNYAVLYIYTYNPNSYSPEQMRLTQHEFVVPVATYNELAWVRWVFDRIASIELHETCESFRFIDERIYAPHHGNGWDPYAFWPGHDVTEKTKAPRQD